MNAWVTHVKNFASRNKMTYGCALSDPRCKSEYHGTKKKSARNPVSFVPKTKTQKPIKKVFKTEAPKTEEPKPTKREMPDELGKLIQDFARPRPPEQVKKSSIKARDEGPVYYQFGESKTKDSALLDMFDEFTRQLIKYKYAIPKKELRVVIYEADTDAIPKDLSKTLEDSDRFYMIPEVNDFIYSYDELGYAVDSYYAQAERNDEEDEYKERQEAEGEEYTRYGEVEYDKYTKKNLNLYKEKNKKALEKAKEKEKAKAKAKGTEEKEQKSMGVEDKLSKQAEKERERERKRLKKLDNERKRKAKEEKEAKKKENPLVEKAKKQLEQMNRARDSGIMMDEDLREDLEDIVRGSGFSFWVEN